MKFIELVDSAYLQAQKNQSKIANDWRVMEQYSVSSKKFKNFLNNLCAGEDINYLELGCFRGGTLVAALSQNKLTSAYAVDNFTYDPLGLYKHPETGAVSQYNPEGWPNVKMGFIEILERLGLDMSVKVWMGDWIKIPPTFIKHKINVVHLDINKDVEAILNTYDNKFDNTFILVVANYNEAHVRDAVASYISNKKYTVKHTVANYSASNADSDGWWNGLGALVVQKKEEDDKKISN